MTTAKTIIPFFDTVSDDVVIEIALHLVARYDGSRETIWTDEGRRGVSGLASTCRRFRDLLLTGRLDAAKTAYLWKDVDLVRVVIHEDHCIKSKAIRPPLTFCGRCTNCTDVFRNLPDFLRFCQLGRDSIRELGMSVQTTDGCVFSFNWYGMGLEEPPLAALSRANFLGLRSSLGLAVETEATRDYLFLETLMALPKITRLRCYFQDNERRGFDLTPAQLPSGAKLTPNRLEALETGGDCPPAVFDLVLGATPGVFDHLQTLVLDDVRHCPKLAPGAFPRVRLLKMHMRKFSGKFARTVAAAFPRLEKLAIELIYSFPDVDAEQFCEMVTSLETVQSLRFSGAGYTYTDRGDDIVEAIAANEKLRLGLRSLELDNRMGLRAFDKFCAFPRLEKLRVIFAREGYPGDMSRTLESIARLDASPGARMRHLSCGGVDRNPLTEKMFGNRVPHPCDPKSCPNTLLFISAKPTPAGDGSGLPPVDVDLVATQCKCSRARAIEALRKHKGDIVNAVMDIGPSYPHQKAIF